MAEETLALVMTDIEDSTTGWDRNGKLMQQLLEAYIDLVEKRLQPPPRIEGFRGDGHLLSFPTVDAAAMAALRLRELWDKRRLSFRRPEWEDTHRLRIGMHWGRVMRLGDDRMVGGEINYCARLEGEAKPGETLVSEEALRHVDQRRFDWSAPREVVFKGFAVPAKGPDWGTPPPRRFMAYPLLGTAGSSADASPPNAAELYRTRLLEDYRRDALAHWDEPETVRALFENVRDLDPQNLAVRGVLADVYLHLGLPGDAEREIREVLRIDSGNADALVRLARMHQSKGELVEAERCLRDAIVHAPNDETYGLLGSVLEKQSRLDEARDAYRLALQNDPTNEELLSALTRFESSEIGSKRLSPYSRGGGGGGRPSG